MYEKSAFLRSTCRSEHPEAQESFFSRLWALTKSSFLLWQPCDQHFFGFLYDDYYYTRTQHSTASCKAAALIKVAVVCFTV